MGEDRIIIRLAADHDRIRAIADGLDRFIDCATPPVGLEFAKLRWTLVREVTQHQALEHVAVLRSTRSAPAPAAPPAHDGGVGAAFTAHMAEWNGAAIQNGWARYRFAARDMLAHLRGQMRHEEAVLFPLLSA